MDGRIGYAVSVIVVPALVAVAAAAPVLVGPLRRRPAAVECAVAFALALAFLLSFVRDLDENAVIRQFVAIEGDRFPIERWHRLALAAIVLALAGPALAVVRAFDGRNAARYYTVGAVTIAAFVAGLLIEFPRATMAGQVLQGATCALAALGFARFSRSGALWNAWIVFGALAALLLLGGFARLMVMSAALSAASFGIALAGFVGARRTRDPVAIEGSGGVGLVLGLLAGLLASAGRGYDQGDLPLWCWTAAALLPFGALVFATQSDRAPSREASTFWRVLGAAILAAILLGAIAASQFAGSTAESEDAGDPMDGIYG